MIQITKLQISNFRNLQSTLIEPGPYFNIFYGQNGAGKTSLLEAIYYFGFGRSFRTNNVLSLIHKDHSLFSLYAQLTAGGMVMPIGIERGIDCRRRIRCNGDNIKSIAPIAELLPIQLISTESYRFFHDGPKLRRQLMNWGLFHVEPYFFSLWQRLLQLLKQRNAALKAHASHAELSVWSDELVILSEKIDAQRKQYISQLTPVLEKLISQVLPTFSLQLSYHPGWDSTIPFINALKQSYYKDQALGYTTVGPHRADLQLLINDKPASEMLSQGQQKLAAYALHLAQGQLVQTVTDKTPIYLIDDLPSELDPEKRHCITSVLNELNAQVFITGITQEELRDVIALDSSSLFHVEHNQIQQN